MVERNEGNSAQKPLEQDIVELEPLLVEDDTTFYPFTKDMKLPTSEELTNAFAQYLDRSSSSFIIRIVDKGNISRHPGPKRRIEYKGIQGIVGVVANFASVVLSNEKIYTPMGDVEFKTVSEDNRLVVKSVPLTFALTFFPKSQEEIELLARRKAEVLGGHIPLNADFDHGLEHFPFHKSSEPQDRRVDIKRLLMGGKFPGFVLFPFDTDKLSGLGVTFREDDSYDKYLQEREAERLEKIRLMEEKHRKMIEECPPVVKEFIERGTQSLETEYHEQALALTQIPLNDYLILLSKEKLAINGFSVFIRYQNTQESVGPRLTLIGRGGSHPTYIFTDGEITDAKNLRGNYNLKNATFISWIFKRDGNDGKPEFTYYLKIEKRAAEVRKIVKDLGIESLQFTFKQAGSWGTYLE